ncbi:alpha/beta fold hydrolase [Nocardioides speluncae]|uniref:alpha/beta fold hydrolase n=1 Tax=Nocardioides speluncae TaxID=2670337 RepID=UPI000D687A35|nr:alpha/beta fold hydrolase [Nocardioides speluncae]
MTFQAASRPEVAQSAEISAPLANGIELCYQTFGEPTDDPLLLVMGLGGPMTWWDADLCRLLASRGFFVIRYDNRDTGRASRLRDRVNRRMLVRAYAGRPVAVPYSLTDLADDAVGLLDHLGIARAHVVGVSMGGMIAQTVAIEHADRVASLTSIMSTTGRRTVGWAHPKLIPNLLAHGSDTAEGYVADAQVVWGRIGSPGYPESPQVLRDRALETWERGQGGRDRAGVVRQMLAVLTQPDRTSALGRLRMPVTVIHGLDDPLVNVSGGRATARAVPGAGLLLVPGMGHDLPAALWELFAETIRRTADRAGRDS